MNGMDLDSSLQPVRPLYPVDVDIVDGEDLAFEHPEDAGLDVAKETETIDA